MIGRVCSRSRLLKPFKGFGSSVNRLYLFAGQGTQEKGMLDALKESYGKEVSRYSKEVGLDFMEMTSSDSANQISKTWVAQPLIVLSQWLHFKHNKYSLHQNDVLIGHSVGEYTALVLANCIDILTALKLVKLRGELIASHTKEESGMLVVVARKADLPTINELVELYQTQVACYNTQSQLVIAGSRKHTQDLYQQFKRRKIISTFLPVSAAFHCRALKSMEKQFSEALSKITINPPEATIIRNVDATPYTSRQHIIEGLTRQLYSPVLFEQSIRALSKDMEFVEVGHKPVLTRFLKEIRSNM